MQKPPERILSGNTGQRLNDRFLQRLAGSSPDPSQDGFQFGKGSFDRREVGRIGRQEQELASSCFDSLFHARTQVDREVIQNDDLSGTKSF